MKGHARTIWTHLRDRFQPPPAPPGRPWSARTSDPRLGEIRLSGVFSPVPGAETVVVIVHGLGGGAESGYCLRAAAAARDLGLASLRFSLRGGDGSGEGIYHAGLVRDLEVALASPEITAHRRIVVAGFSLGGHVALRLALAPPPGLSAVAAVCSPLDLDASCRFIDAPAQAPYRHYLLRGLLRHYERVAARREVSIPTPIREARAIRRLRDWDDAIVAPWFGFENAADYYARESAGPRLSEVRVPSLYVWSEDDPIIAAETVRPSLSRAAPAPAGERPLCASTRLAVLEERGGHLGFRTDRDLGLPGLPGVTSQILSWLSAAPPAR